MTDGIIQEVISKYSKLYDKGILLHPLRIQRELIERIKQEVDKMQMSIIYRDGLKRVLIGDNQE